MKKSELKKYIREIILSEVDIDKTAGSVVMSKTAPPAEIKKITSQNIDVQLKEMATFYKVTDEDGFKKVLSKYKKLKGEGKWDKNALGQLLSILDKEGEVDIKTLAKEKGKDTATWNNPNTRAALEGGEFKGYVEAGKGKKEEKSKKEEPKKKEEKPKAKKEEPKSKAKKKDDEEDEVEDNWNKSEDDEIEDEDKIDKKAQAAAKKGGSNLTKLNRVTTQLKELEKEMKDLAGKYKAAEGKEKENLLSKLKEKTQTKKELEKMQDKLADLIG